MTTTYATANANNANNAAAPKWRVMTRRTCAVRGTSKNALQAACRARLTPHERAVWRLQGSRCGWRHCLFDNYVDISLERRDRARMRVREDCEFFSKDFSGAFCGRFGPGPTALTSRELLARGEDWLNRHPVCHLLVESPERDYWNWLSSRVMLFGFRIRALARAHWRMVRGPILKRAVVLYWQEQTQRALAAPGGAGRRADREAFESAFAPCC